MKLSNNTDFFQKKENPVSKQTDLVLSELIKQTTEVLDKCGFKEMSAQVNQIQKDISRERFIVSVVGEFSNGKSTFINSLLGDETMLPVGNLPTTAILTHIRYADQPKMVVFDDKGARQSVLDIRAESWVGLTVENFGEKNPKGCVIMGIPNAWLGKYHIELIDCPGAGDLSEERAQIIGEVLDRANGAIIALNATTALSNSERIFIRNRIVSRKIPFTLIIVNKLDLVRKEERSKVIRYIQNLLALNKITIPVFVPYDIEMPDDEYNDIIGKEKVLSEVAKWTRHPQRQHLVRAWVKARIGEIVNNAIVTLSERENLLKLDDNKRLEMIASKKHALSKLEIEWNDLALKLQAKSNECYARFLKKAEEYTLDITEKLQYEVSHAPSPEKWWKEDYPYRLKVELANMSVGLENVIARTVASNAKWFNDLLNQKFRSIVQVGNILIADKEEYKNQKSERTLEFENLSKRQNVARVGTVVLSLALAPVFGLVATMGVGTVGALLSASVFKKKIEEQRAYVKDAIAKDIPNIIMQATVKSEQRIKKLYEEMLADSDKKKYAWLEAQSVAIEIAKPSKVQDALGAVSENIKKLNELLNTIE